MSWTLPKLRVVKTLGEAEAYRDKFLLNQELMAIDSEFIRHSNQITVWSLSNGETLDVLYAETLPVFKLWLADRKRKKIGWGVANDMTSFARSGAPLRGVSADVMVMAFYVDENLYIKPRSHIDGKPYGLKSSAWRDLHYKMGEYKEVCGYVPYGKKKSILVDQRDILNGLVPDEALEVGPHTQTAWLDRFLQYAGEDAFFTFRLYLRYKRIMREEKTWNYYCKEEGPFTTTLWKVQQRGIPVDKEFLESLHRKLDRNIRRTHHKLCTTILRPTFNPRSAPQKHSVFFEQLEYPVVGQTNTGNPSIDKEARAIYAAKGPKFAAAQLLDAISKDGFLDTGFVQPILNGLDEDGLIRTEFNQIAAVSGRISSRKMTTENEDGKQIKTGMQLQNIPVDEDKDPYRIRKAFKAPRNYRLVVADFDQGELKLLADFSEDPVLLDAYNSKPQKDVHLITATSIFGEKTLKKATPGKFHDMRKAGKTTNFSIAYGATGYTVSYRLGISEEEGDLYVTKFFRTYKGVKRWMQGIKRQIYRNPIVRTISGRVRHIVGLDSDDRSIVGHAERQAVNCVDMKTEVLTQRGWVGGTELTLKDQILTKNAETGVLEWQLPEKINQYPRYNGRLVEFTSKTFSAVTTPHHRWLVRNKTTQRDECRTTTTLSKYGDHRIHRTGEFQGKWSSPYTNDFVELVGWVLTDGHFKKAPYDTSMVTLTQSQRAHPDLVKRIDALLARMHLNPKRSVVEWSQAVVWMISGDVPRLMRKLFPGRVLTPEFLCSLTYEQLRLLLWSMMLGDGTAEENKGASHGHLRFCARHKDAIDAFQMLCTLTGSASTVKWRDMSMYKPRSSKLKNIPRMSGVWLATILRRDKVQVVNSQCHEYDSREGVWCPTVPNGYWVARRDGKVFITGNSPIQGSLADICKEAMNRVEKDKQLRKWGYRMLLQVHDEIVGMAPKRNAKKALARVVLIMGQVRFEELQPPKKTPMTASGGIGRTWEEAKH